MAELYRHSNGKDDIITQARLIRHRYGDSMAAFKQQWNIDLATELTPVYAACVASGGHKLHFTTHSTPDVCVYCGYTEWVD